MRLPLKAKTGALFVLLSISIPLLWQSSVAQTTATPNATKSNNEASAKPNYANEAFVLELFKTSYRFEKDGTGQRELSLRVKVQSDAGVGRFGQLIFGYSSAIEKLDIDFVRVSKPDGTVVNSSNIDVQDLSAPVTTEAPVYTDLRQKHVTVPGLRPGDVLEYHVTWHVNTALALNQFWMEHDFVPKELIVLNEELSINIPKESKVKLKTAAGLETVPVEIGDRREYKWKRQNLQRKDDGKDKDNYQEDKEDSEEETNEVKPPEVQMTTFQSWDEVGQWYAGLQTSRIIPDEKIRAKAKEITASAATDKDKVKAIYEYVAKNFRYVSLSLGEGRYQPHAASDVLANEYGDCKDKHTLFAAMLTAAGLTGYPALMNATRKIDPDVPSPGQFNHVITTVPLGSETYWADTTAEIAPFQLLSPTLRDKKALVIPVGGTAKLETTPAIPPFKSTETMTIVGTVSDLGKLVAHTHIELRGDSELLFRMMFRKTPQSDWKNLGRVLSAVSGIRGEVSGIKISEPTALEKPFEIDYDISEGDFIDWSSKRIKLDIPLPSLHLSSRSSKAKESQPVQIGAPIDASYRLKLTFPSKYHARLPLPVTVKRDYADYSATYKIDVNTLLAERTLHTRQYELPGVRLQDYRAFVAATRSDESQTLALETDLAGTPSIPDSVTTDELIQAGETATKNNNYPMAEELYKRVLLKDSKNKRIRRDLAYALYSQRKYDETISVLEEQSKINPFDDYAYNLMGRVYWQQQKYPDAEKAFRKQLEITPLDESTHANLGEMLVDWRRYKEAVPEMESAISLDPESESLQVGLANAYLHLGEEKKGIEACDAAIKLDPGPSTWNDVAYLMAEVNTHLDRAQQYAESAVTAVATELRNAELENLTDDDLSNVSSLYSYWDTLGWVYFRKGDLDNAEKYIRAAWTLGRASAVSYHLGQVVEKRGNKEEAIKLYVFAMAADSPVPEAREALEKLVSKEQIEILMKPAKADLVTTYILKLDWTVPGLKSQAVADFMLSLTPDSSHKSQIVDVKFIKGSEELRQFAPKLKSLNYGLTFPDSNPTKVVRRGTLSCIIDGPCIIHLIRPDLVMSPN